MSLSEYNWAVAHATRSAKGSQSCREDADDDLNDGLSSFLLQRTLLLVLQRAVERAETLYLHLLRVEEHLKQTASELLQYAVNDVGSVDRAVLRDVVGQLSGVQRFEVLDLCVPLAGSR